MNEELSAEMDWTFWETAELIEAGVYYRKGWFCFCSPGEFPGDAGSVVRSATPERQQQYLRRTGASGPILWEGEGESWSVEVRADGSVWERIRRVWTRQEEDWLDPNLETRFASWGEREYRICAETTALLQRPY